MAQWRYLRLYVFYQKQPWGRGIWGVFIAQLCSIPCLANQFFLYQCIFLRKIFPKIYVRPNQDKEIICIYYKMYKMTKYVLTVFWAFQIQADLEQYRRFIDKPLLSYRTSKKDHVNLGITKT